ncbi:hypothetical protein C8J57DRAFT_1229424 [Mycena rebaudengoi]|nr:hypothetical protein C8J57DRAFT_1229424 [Mycena rebaudengoi]
MTSQHVLLGLLGIPSIINLMIRNGDKTCFFPICLILQARWHTLHLIPMSSWHTLEWMLKGHGSDQYLVYCWVCWAYPVLVTYGNSVGISPCATGLMSIFMDMDRINPQKYGWGAKRLLKNVIVAFHQYFIPRDPSTGAFELRFEVGVVPCALRRFPNWIYEKASFSHAVSRSLLENSI